ncbi:hypothetical protein ACFQ30_17380 [Devosia equisanguinis]|uniref:hypothetical protein n=1 Tax=Devosia equisanguinis TaxID=2490941 RepID=UPI0036331569
MLNKWPRAARIQDHADHDFGDDIFPIRDSFDLRSSAPLTQRSKPERTETESRQGAQSCFVHRQIWCGAEPLPTSAGRCAGNAPKIGENPFIRVNKG